jgi:mono/diheme cytochrome c family protein
MKRRYAILIFCLVSAAVTMAMAGRDWMTEVPSRDRQKSNPFRNRDQEQAIRAGRWLFAEHCAECHGDNAGGKKKRPSLRTARIQSEATEGDVHWLLVNGNMRHGMPSWSKLPDQQIWQLVSYLKSLKTAD